MNKLKKTWIVIVLILYLTTFNTNTKNQDIILVQGAIKPTSNSEIVIGVDFSHLNNVSSNELTNLTSILNTTFSSQKIIFLREKFTPGISGNLANIDVLTILAPTIAYSDQEIQAIEEFIESGKSLFIASGFRDQVEEPINELSSFYGLSYDFTNPITPKNLIARGFLTPATPLIENISQVMFTNGMRISFNESRLESDNSPAIVSYNPILVKDLDTPPSENNTLIYSIEFQSGARLLAVGSVDMFNNSYIEPLSNNTNIFLDNTDFFLNAIKWLGKNTGVMKFLDPWVDLDGRRIQLGQVIHGNVTVVNSRNQSLSQVQVVIALENTGSLLSSRNMRVDPSNASKFFGWVNTEGLTYGWRDVVFSAKLVGYFPIELRSAGRIYLDPPFPTPLPPDIAIFGGYLVTIMIFFSTTLFLYLNIKKKE